MIAILRAKDGRIRTDWRVVVFLAGVVGVAVGGRLGMKLLEDVLGITAAARLMSWQAALRVALVTALGFGWAALCRRVMDHRPVSSLGLRPAPRQGVKLAGGALLGAGLICAGIGVLYVAGGYRYAGPGDAALLPVAATLFLFAAFAEEIVLRGYVLQNMRDIRRPVAGIIISSVIFSGFHGLNPAVGSSFVPALNLFLAGVLLGLAYIASGNIWFPTALHYGWNMMEGPVLGTPVSGMSMEGWLNFERTAEASQFLSGGEFGLEGSVVVTGIQCVAICGFLVVLWFRRSAEGGEAGAGERSGGRP